MVDFVQYDYKIFNELNHFDVVKTQVNDMKSAIQELGSVIKKHNMRHLGVALLHKHFDLLDNEKLIEEEVQHSSTVKPTLSSDSCLPYLWKITSAGFCPLEFCVPTVDKTERVFALIKSTSFLNEFHDLVMKLGVSDILGLTVVHRDHVSCVEGGTMELTNEQERTLTIVPPSEAAEQIAGLGDDHETITTVWRFGPEEDAVEDKCNHCNHCRHMLGG